MEQEQFNGKFLRVTTENRLDGRVVERVYVRHGVTIIAMNEHDEICFIKEEDVYSGKVVGKLPSGYIEDGEDPLISAQRELQEETGITADHWELFVHSQMKGPVFKSQHYFIARGLHAGVASPEESEDISSVYFSTKAITRLSVLKGDFGTGSTAYVLLKLLQE